MRLPDPDGFRLLRRAEALAETPRSQDDGWTCITAFASAAARAVDRGNIPELGGRFVMVCVNALDDIPEADLVAAPVFANGAQDDWWNPAPETRHPERSGQS